MRIDNFVFIKPVHIWIVISAIWILIQLYWYYQVGGVVVANDTRRFLDLATNESFSEIWNSFNRFYLIFILLLKLDIWLNSGLYLSWSLNFILGCSSLLLLSYTVTTITKNQITGIFTCILMLLNPFYHQWNQYILTDAIFIHCMVIWSCGLALFLFSKRKIPAFSIVSIGFFLIFLRPVGIISFATGVFALIIFNTKNKKWQYLFIGLFAACSLAGFNLIAEHYNLLEQSLTGELVYGVNSINYHNVSNLSIPAPQEYKRINSYPLLELAHLTFHEPLFYSKLFFGKLFYFIFQWRPYYSTEHNLFLLILIPLYALSIKGIFRMSAKLRAVWLYFVSLYLIMIGTIVTSWEGRFYISFYPIIVVAAAIGLSDILIKRNQK